MGGFLHIRGWKRQGCGLHGVIAQRSVRVASRALPRSICYSKGLTGPAVVGRDDRDGREADTKGVVGATRCDS